MKKTKTIKAWAVIDKKGNLYHRNGGSPSVFLTRWGGMKTANFLAYDWIDEKQEAKIIPCKITYET